MCLTAGCDKKVVCRGLCANCYASARNAVKSGKVSWKGLEEIGLAKASSRASEIGSSLFSQALERRIAELSPPDEGQVEA